jgi:hypothetical protein
MFSTPPLVPGSARPRIRNWKARWPGRRALIEKKPGQRGYCWAGAA